MASSSNSICLGVIFAKAWVKCTWVNVMGNSILKCTIYLQKYRRFLWAEQRKTKRKFESHRHIVVASFYMRDIVCQIETRSGSPVKIYANKKRFCTQTMATTPNLSPSRCSSKLLEIILMSFADITLQSMCWSNLSYQ